MLLLVYYSIIECSLLYLMLLNILHIMRPRGDLFVFALCNGCHELNKKTKMYQCDLCRSI